MARLFRHCAVLAQENTSRPEDARWFWWQRRVEVVIVEVLKELNVMQTLVTATLELQRCVFTGVSTSGGGNTAGSQGSHSELYLQLLLLPTPCDPA